LADLFRSWRGWITKETFLGTLAEKELRSSRLNQILIKPAVPDLGAGGQTQKKDKN
jgi:hypothetical protein